MGFDQWSALYDQYVVIGAKLTAYITYQAQNESSGNPPMCVGVYLGDDASIPYADWRGLVESRRGTHRHITANQAAPVRVVGKFSCKRFFNIKDPRDALERVGALVSANPAETATWIIWGNTTGSLAPATGVQMNVSVIIDYIVQWSEPKDLSRS